MQDLHKSSIGNAIQSFSNYKLYLFNPLTPICMQRIVIAYFSIFVMKPLTNLLERQPCKYLQ